jgi:transposase
LLFVGDDWAEAHHDVELMDAAGRRLAKARLGEGVAGMARLHAMIGEQFGEDAEDAEVAVGIETEWGRWVVALIAAGYTVYAINPLQVARYRERHSVSGAQSDAADAYTLADMVRTDSHQLRPVAADSAAAGAVKVVTRAHKTLIFRTDPSHPAAAARAAGVFPAPCQLVRSGAPRRSFSAWLRRDGRSCRWFRLRWSAR